MEEAFFDKRNYDILYTVINDDLEKRYSYNLDSLPVNAGDIIYEGMINAFNNNSGTETLYDLNKMVIGSSIPRIINSKKEIADDKLDIFKNAENSEDLEGSLKPKENNAENEKETRVEIEYDLDIGSQDRKEWKIDSVTNAYYLDVNFGVGSTFPGIGTQLTLKNVKSIDIGHVILPNINGSLDKYPFLYLEIEELKGMQHSTSEQGRRSLKLLRDKKWDESDSSNISYILMSNRLHSSNQSSDSWFSTDSHINITKMSIRILSPNGYQISSGKDIFEISDISDGSSDILTLIINSNFSSEELHIGNRIGFKDIVCDNIELKKYLENSDHTIVAVDTSTKQVDISKKESGYDATGNSTYTNYTNIGFNSGKCMNLSVQSTFGFNVKSVKYGFPEKQLLT